MKKFNSLFIFFIFPVVANSQAHDHVWLMGNYGSIPNPLYGGVLINFNSVPFSIGTIQNTMSFNATNSSISDENGNLLFYTNGIQVADATHHIMMNGDSINNVGTTYLYKDLGLVINQGALTLPVPDSDSLYIIFHVPIDFVSGGLNTNIPFLFMSEVNMNLNGGKGTIVAKDEIIIEDTLGFGKLTACKHANGRDWWIIMQEDDQMNNGLYTLLLTPTGIENLGKQEFDIPILNNEASVGNALFTPDGTKYIRSDIRFAPWNAITIYDFNRCVGELTPLEYFEINDTTFLYGGAVVSPDSRYLYVVANNFIYQFDLSASNIEATKTLVAEYDGFVGLFFRTLFGTPQLAPDGSIWIASTSDTVMHVIRTPNQPGTACHVDQHAIHLPRVNQKSIPNFPNYRLGPLDGSPCDTLGLDNHPLAGFTWWPDELAVTFSDNSYYRPEAWAWDFGDGASSTERNPVHTYGAPGEYFVCLTVSNEYSSDTICHWVQVDTLTTMVDVVGQEKAEKSSFRVFPNPANEWINLEIQLPWAEAFEWSLYNTLGEKVKRLRLTGQQKGIQTVPVSDLTTGLYFWELENNGQRIGQGKLMIVK